MNIAASIVAAQISRRNEEERLKKINTLPIKQAQPGCGNDGCEGGFIHEKGGLYGMCKKCDGKGK